MPRVATSEKSGCPDKKSASSDSSQGKREAIQKRWPGKERKEERIGPSQFFSQSTVRLSRSGDFVLAEGQTPDTEIAGPRAHAAFARAVSQATTEIVQIEDAPTRIELHIAAAKLHPRLGNVSASRRSFKIATESSQ